MSKRLSTLKVGEKFKLTEITHITVKGFIYKVQPDNATWEVVKTNKTTIVATNGKSTTPTYFKFTKTGHWRSDGKDCFVETI